MATYPLATLAATVTATGISAPPYSDIYASLQATFKIIYGTDAYIEPDSQDGQMLAIVAKAISDCNDATIDAYNSFSPQTAQSQALSNNVKINGISRASPSNSQVQLIIGGDIGATINFGVAGDDAGTRWLLPGIVTIPAEGEIEVTALAAVPGTVSANIGTVVKILTPTLGWQTVTNPSAASEGAPIESDAALRRRQTYSTALPSRTVLDGIVGAVASLPGVVEVVGYENDTDVTDSNGLPEHSTAIVTLGGDSQQIAQAYLNKKTPGAFTYGTTPVNVTSSTGIPHVIRYFVVSNVRVMVAIDIQGSVAAGYTTAVGIAIKQAVADYINALRIGKKVDNGRIYLPAQFFGAPASASFEVNQVRLSIYPAVPVEADVIIAFNERATCDVDDITLNVS